MVLTTARDCKVLALFFYFQVHHITADGQDGGKLFNEAAQRAKTSDDLFEQEADSLLYPGECNLKFNPFGTVNNLRTSTSIDKIRDYHRRYYRPDNMVVLVSGKVDKKKLFGSFQTIEYEAKREVEPLRKKGSKPCASVGKVVEKELEYPDGMSVQPMLQPISLSF